MATKLYPPYINGTIPAFAGTTLVVPFSMNQAVGNVEVAGFSAKIKTVNGIILDTITSINYNFSNYEVIFNLDEDFIEEKLNVGQYYKIQLAYLDSNDVVGYYSTVGVVKYTEEPNVYIEGLSAYDYNSYNHNYIGVYSQENKDTTEKLYSSYFILKDENKNIIIKTDEVLHIVNNDDNNYEGFEEFLLSRDLEFNKVYFLQFITTSTNGMVRKSPNYKIIQVSSMDTYITSTLTAVNNFEEGYIDILLSGDEQSLTGTFVLSRTIEDDSASWEYLKYYDLSECASTNFIYRDFTIEQGVDYIYSLQQYNSYGIMSNRIISNTITADFEDMFLFDGTRQLKVRYNPKVATYKRDVLETKIDTIGGKYPYIVRNGNTDYKEFSLSGLLSFNSDEAGLFMLNSVNTDDIRERTETTLGIKNKFTYYSSSTNLVSENIYNEREFKNKVLEWLTDGNPKLLRTSTEGNFLVRLMNVSFAPNDTLGRMLHTFTSTAYEIDAHDANTLNDYSIINNTKNENSVLKDIFNSVSFSDLVLEDNYGEYYSLNLVNTINYLKRTNLTEEEYTNLWSELYKLNCKQEKFSDFFDTDAPVYLIQKCSQDENFDSSALYFSQNDNLVSFDERDSLSDLSFNNHKTLFYKKISPSKDSGYLDNNIESARWPTLSWYQVAIDSKPVFNLEWDKIGWNRNNSKTLLNQYEITHFYVNHSEEQNKLYEKIYENDNLNYVDTNNIRSLHWVQKCQENDTYQSDRVYYYDLTALTDMLIEQIDTEIQSFLHGNDSLYLPEVVTITSGISDESAILGTGVLGKLIIGMVNSTQTSQDYKYAIDNLIREERIFNIINEHYQNSLEASVVKNSLLTIVNNILKKIEDYKKYSVNLINAREALLYNIQNEKLKARLTSIVDSKIKELYIKNPTNFYLTILKNEPRIATHYYLLDPCQEKDDFEENNWVMVFDNNSSENINYLKIDKLLPGTKIRIDKQEIMIGATGCYIVNPDTIISKIYVEKNALQQEGSYLELTYQTLETQKTNISLFDSLKSIRVHAFPARQITGKIDDIFSKLSDINSELLQVFFVKFYKKSLPETELNSEDEYYKILKNGEKIDIKDVNVYEIDSNNVDDIISIGEGIIAEVSYLTKIITYSFPDDVIVKIGENPDEILSNYETLTNKYFENYGTDKQIVSEEELIKIYQNYLDAVKNCLTAYKELYNIQEAEA